MISQLGTSGSKLGSIELGIGGIHGPQTYTPTVSETLALTELALVQRRGSTTLFITSGTTFTEPSDWPGIADTVECVGGGAGGRNAGFHVGTGGGGGEYALKYNVLLANGDSIQIGVGGGPSTDGTNTWVKTTSTVLAHGGTAGSDGVAGQGGTGGVGDVTNAGGNGGGIGTDQTGGGGGGSAGGLTGPGFDGGLGGTLSAAPGGGGTGGIGGTAVGGVAGDGGIAQDSTAGGAGGSAGGAGPQPGSHGSGGGGGAAGNESGANGGDGVEWDATHGSGGGGGGSDQNTGINHFGGNGGLYGGGGGGEAWSHQAGSSGGTGSDGIIVITYTPATGRGNVSESITLTETLSLNRHKTVGISEFINIIESARGRLPTHWIANIHNGFTIFEALAPAAILNRTISQSLTLASVASIRTPQTFTLTVHESLIINQGNITPIVNAESISEVLVLVEEYKRGFGLLHAFDENLAFTERLSVEKYKPGPISQTLIINQTLALVLAHKRSINEAIAAVETITNANVFIRNISETLPLKGGMIKALRSVSII